ncbi:BREX system P-loop protein BrxC [Pseudomonas helleri]|uniref:BREX system P-loop protein BrxC n=1 Tax=Pseudomonas helleri TaxID=1608996 RepID=A0A7X2CGK3_9PSED|nr:BREX system P-loop protein BrxC [Pseudomonas helleri]MQT94912.1 BREX system P-loop protein BrxC [Pseudomonas helleri]MQU30288.1 BREX system P-loop protein BrxC [Pseudomonas helleri]
MLNRDIYQKDPSTRRLVNEGVASVNDEKTSQALSVLRYELETFVCDGQYEKGLEHMLDVYLKNIEQAEQPAVWVSGFYGSGKSHLVKMLRALWVDSAFDDGATARGIATLPQSVSDQFKELTTQAKRHGGLHAASGTLGSSSRDKSVRMAVLGILFKSVDLPEQYPVARFVMWLQHEGIYDTVRGYVEKSGFDWSEELDNFYVAEGLHEALVKAKPNLFTSPASCVETLNNLYPYVQDVSSGDMLKAIRQALTRDGKFPLTLVVLDEVQQYIGEDSQRSIDVQEVVEACCKNIGAKMLFIGTGQTAVTGTSNLKKLEGRFTVRVELSDADVDAVIRQVILAKKPEAKAPVEKAMQTNLGEISRHLAGTTIGHRADDIQFFLQDYPILPVRRRFWENTLRVLDQTGTDSQLRNQLSMIHKVIQTNVDAPVGSVVPADYLYFDAADKLLQSRILPRKVHEKTMVWAKGTEDQRLMGRACGLVFLINKLASNNNEIGIQANVDTLADLLVEDLTHGSSALRSKLPSLLDKCELLMKVGDEYRIQTEESAAWNDEFLSQRNSLANEAHRIEAERDDRIRKKFGEVVRKQPLIHGASRVPRDIYPVFDAQLPGDANDKICVWVRDGWSADDNSVRVDARQAGNQSPTIYVFIPKRSADDLRHYLIEFKAASATLDKRGVPNTAEGTEARSAMETTKQTAEGKIRELLQEAFSGARVFQGGGNEILGNDLQAMTLEAANNALQRLYPQFHIADHAGWETVLKKAQNGAPDALKSVGDEGEPAKNPVCKAILAFIAGGKKGTDIRKHFDGANYGWSKDAIEGGVQVLLVAGLIRAHDEKGQTIDPKDLERRDIGKTLFKVESATVSAGQRIQIRKVLQKVGLTAKQGEELAHLPQFLVSARALASRAGGDAPRPAPPVTSGLEEIRLTAGNEQLLALYNQRDELSAAIDTWTDLAERIDKRLPGWNILKRLLTQVNGLSGGEVLAAQVAHLEQQRQLLEEPDPVAPMVAGLTQLLRDELNRLHADYQARHQNGMARLDAGANWKQLEPEQRNSLLAAQKLTLSDAPKVLVANTEEVLTTVDRLSLSSFADRVAAIDSRFDAILVAAAELMEPKAQFVKLPTRTIKSAEDIEAWLQDAKQTIAQALVNGPVILH